MWFDLLISPIFMAGIVLSTESGERSKTKNINHSRCTKICSLEKGKMLQMP